MINCDTTTMIITRSLSCTHTDKQSLSPVLYHTTLQLSAAGRAAVENTLLTVSLTYCGFNCVCISGYVRENVGHECVPAFDSGDCGWKVYTSKVK